jgi:putative cell wall-binding protein
MPPLSRPWSRVGKFRELDRTNVRFGNQSTTRHASWVGRLASESVKTCKVPNRAICSGIGGAIQDCAFGLSHLATTTSLMEARVTTATRRLRRASIAGLATIATAAAVVGSAGSALAFSGATGVVGISGSASTLFPGQATQALPSVTVAFTNGSWVSGDFITFSLSSSGTAVTPICQTSSNLNKSAAWAGTPTVTGSDTGGATVGAATITATSSANCNAHDSFQLALPASPGDSGTTTFTVANLSASLGSAIAAGAVFVTGTASNGTPFVGPVATAGAQVGTVATVSVTSASSLGLSPSQSNITPPTVTVTDVTGGQVTLGLSFALPAGDAWTTLPTLTDPAGVTSTTASVTGGTTVVYQLTGTTPAGGVYKLTGGAISVGATLGAVVETVKTGAFPTPATTLGAPQIGFVGTQNRIGGADRYGTASLIFGEEFGTVTPTSAGITPSFTAPTTATNVVVTSGTNFPDALSSAYLASSLSTGILLTDPNVLPSATQQALTNGHVANVYVVGGPAAVSQNVFNSISALKNPVSGLNLNVIRVAGADRYATNEAADLNAGVVGTGSQTAILATGANFADALAASPAIAKLHYPLILTAPNALPASASATITALGVKNIIIVGGTAAVSTAVETAVKALPGVSVLQRIAGADRTLTAQQIATWETQGLAAGSYTALPAAGFHWAAGGNVNISNGGNFPDALAAGPALAKAGAGALGEPLLLSASPTVLGAGIPGFLGGTHATVATVSAIGLASAVSGSVLAGAAGSIS